VFDDDDLRKARRMHGAGYGPADILRAAARARPEASVVHLMDLLEAAFGLPHEAVQCLGGWWYDGTPELSDAQINAFIAPAIERALAERQGGGKP
jgi:hypothetical protein